MKKLLRFLPVCTLLYSLAACKEPQEATPNQTLSTPSAGQAGSDDAATESNQIARRSEPTVVSSKIEDLEQESTNQHSYNLKETNNDGMCETKQAFDDEQSYCEGLKDEELNDDCAKSQREDLYLVDCAAEYGRF